MTTRYVTLAAAVTLAGCAQFRPPPEGAEPTASSSGRCAARAMIEDGEDGDDQVLTRAGRGGYLYTYADEAGTTVAPRGDFTMGRGGAGGSGGAIHVAGKLAAGGDAYAGVGLGFVEPKGAYDASSYTGVAFAARRAPDTTPYVRLKVPDVNTDPDGGVCTDCYNDFGVSMQLTEEWTRYEVRFADLAQEGGWGAPRPDAVDAAKLYGVQWQVSTAGAPFDVWIDDVTFLGCGE